MYTVHRKDISNKSKKGYIYLANYYSYNMVSYTHLKNLK